MLIDRTQEQACLGILTPDTRSFSIRLAFLTLSFSPRIFILTLGMYELGAVLIRIKGPIQGLEILASCSRSSSRVGVPPLWRERPSLALKSVSEADKTGLQWSDA